MTTEKALRNFTDAATEAARRYEDRQRSLSQAKGLLRPDEVAGDYDANRLLQTTLGGVLRPLTHEDLKTFQANARKLGDKFKGGMTIKQIVNRSLKIDRDRANEEIRTAVIRQAGGGKIHFITNASKGSEARRHHVLLDLVDFETAAAAPAKAPEAATLGLSGKIRCACDCGRWTFWFSYLATIGKFNAGRPQQNFPKIRNPQLTGVACKHVLRVLQVAQTPAVRHAVAVMIEKARRGEGNKVQAMTRQQARAMAQEQVKRSGQKNAQIETAAERKDRLAAQRSVMTQVQKSKVGATKSARALKVMERNLANMIAAGGLTKAQVQKMMEAALARMK